MVLGTVASVLNGTVHPIFSIIFAKIITVSKTNILTHWAVLKKAWPLISKGWQVGLPVVADSLGPTINQCYQGEPVSTVKCSRVPADCLTSTLSAIMQPISLQLFKQWQFCITSEGKEIQVWDCAQGPRMGGRFEHCPSSMLIPRLPDLVQLCPDNMNANLHLIPNFQNIL